MSATPKLSKSQYIRGLQCPKSLWFYRNRKDIAPDVGRQKQALFDSGHAFGEIAKQYFDGGVEVTEPYWEIKGAAETTKRLVREGHQVIFEATAIHPVDGSYSRIDILCRIPDSDEWEMIEVKGSTGVKDYHIDDMAFQYHVFYHAGFRVRRCYMMLVDNAYVRQGEIEPRKIMKMEDVSPLVFAKQGEVEYMAAQLGYVLDRKNEPEARIGARCFAPFECDYKDHCWRAADVPAYSIYDVFTKNKADEIAARYGVYALEKIPPEVVPGGRKAVDIAAYLSGKTHEQAVPIRDFTESLQYPLYFLDYETLMPAIPLFDGTRPYQQVPFQFSLHILDAPGGDLRHHEFLHKERSDPRLPFVRNLVNLCETDGSVVTYNQAFEAARNNELAQDFPDYADDLKAINARMADLLVPFRNRWLYHPDQKGSASIKAVLPAFTDISYDSLEIADGGTASLQYLMFMTAKIPDEDLPTLWKQLAEYCHQDTYAMKILLDILYEKARS